VSKTFTDQSFSELFGEVVNEIFSEEGTGTHFKINKLFNGRNRLLAPAVIEVVNGLRAYWPLTVRQIYYQCVSKLLIPNKKTAYKGMSKMCTTLRRNNLLPWGCIEDRTRRTTDKRGVSNLKEFIREQTESYLGWRYYHRCRVQEQEVYIEVATEKDALASIMEEVIWPYCVRLNIVKGQVGATMVKDMSKRYEKSIAQGLEPVLLYFGDLDPSGVAIPKALKRNLLDWHGVDVKLVRVALNVDQLAEYDLPMSIDAAKEDDPNYGAWIEEYGDTSPTELDALHPQQLENLVSSSIESHLDMESYREQMEIEKEEREELKDMRFRILDYAYQEYPGYFDDEVS